MFFQDAQIARNGTHSAIRKVEDVMLNNDFEVANLIKIALLEDAPYGDVTTESLEIRGNGSGIFLAKEDFVLCGFTIASKVFKYIQNDVRVISKYQDGNFIRKGMQFGIVKGNLDTLLFGERTALNFLQRLSGIATRTKWAVNLLRGTKATLLDTRKTTPLLRNLEKYAVRVGGGTNHRMGLSDAILIKDNHIECMGSVTEAIKKAKKYNPFKKVEVEVKNLKEFEEALKCKPDIILLDNFSLEDIRKAVKLKPRDIPLEASGGITLENLQSVAKCGVDFISMGSLTHTVKSIDISFEIKRV